MAALDQSLLNITAEVVRMLSLVRQSNGLARRALIDGDVDAAHECIQNDKVIDGLMESLERDVLITIARQQPAAGDLRFLGAMYRSLADIERAGDYAVHVAKVGAELAGQPRLKKYVDLERILVVLNDMLERTTEGLTDRDVDAAREALAMDDEIDLLDQQIQRELLTYMMEHPDRLSSALLLINTGRYLERMGDHLENVNEHVIFWLTGERI